MYYSKFFLTHKCWFCNLSEDGGVTGYIISDTDKGNRTFFIVEIRGEKEKLDKLTTKLRRKYNVRVFIREEERRIFRIAIPFQSDNVYESNLSNIAVRNDCIISRMIGIPHMSKDNFEEIEVYSDRKKNILSLKKDFSRIAKVTSTGIVEKNVQTAVDFRNLFFTTFEKLKLTQRQEECFTLAFSSHYYNWPRGITLEELAKKMNISRKTFQQHLRKAERKMLDFARSAMHSS